MLPAWLTTALAEDRPSFVRFARRHVKTRAEAEDVVQRAFVRAAERARSLTDPARARPWFYQVLRNVISDHHRALARDPVARADAPSLELADEPVTQRPSACACAVTLLEDLKPSYSEVLKRVDMEGEAPTAVAATLDISQGNLDVRLHRARKSLREKVCAYCGVPSGAACLDCSCDGARRCGLQ